VKKSKKALLLAGLGYGDEGKGSIVDYLAVKHDAKIIVRYNGGSQALHHVVRPDGLVHGFRQLGSGMLAQPRLRTYLSRFMAVDPLFLSGEINDLTIKKGIKYSFGQVIIDRDCVVITPFHRIVNQMLETSRCHARLGSCGHGVGEALKDFAHMGSDTLLVGDLIDRERTKRKLRLLLDMKIDLAEQVIGGLGQYVFYFTDKLNHQLFQLRDYHSWLDRLSQNYFDRFEFGFFKLGDQKNLSRLLGRSETVIFEGAQGVLLDPCFGFSPHITRTRTNFENADQILGEINYDGEVTKIGVTRAYATRHGAGPFVTEENGLAELIPEIHNQENEWQGAFKIGWLDLVATRYAINVLGKVDQIAVTNMDRIAGLKTFKLCNAYSMPAAPGNIFGDFFELEKMGDGARVMVQNIKKPTFIPEGRQNLLTKLLDICQPDYTTLRKPSANMFVSLIEEGLRVPVSLMSNGPTFKDKVDFSTSL